MTWLAEVSRRFRMLLVGSRFRRDLDDEMRLHAELRQEKLQREGLSARDATYAARRRFGSALTYRERSLEVWGWRWLDDGRRDLHYALRALRRTPAYTTVAVLMFALGVGLTTSIFSVAYGVLLRPLPFPEPHQLVVLHTIRQQGDTFDNAVSPPNFMSLKEEGSESFSGLAGALAARRTLLGMDDAQTVVGARVSDGFFEVLGVRPSLGRTFTPNENEPGQDHVVVLSHGLWQAQFGGDGSVIGRTAVLDGVTHAIVGVMPREFDFHGMVFWVPQPYGLNYFSAATSAGRSGDAIVRVVGRLRPGVSLEAAEAELAVRSWQLAQRFPETNTGVRVRPVPLHRELVGDVRTPLLLLLIAVGSVLLIAVANVAGLLFARTAGRQDEIAIRGALGAGRMRIVRQVVTESLVVSVAGGALGLAMAIWATDWIAAARLDRLSRLGLADAIRVDRAVLAFATGVTLLAGMLASLVPAFRAAEEGLANGLQRGGRTGSGSRTGRRIRSGLVVGQLALTVTLLYGAGLLFHSFVRLTAVDPGFRTERVISFRISLPPAVYQSSQRIEAFYSELLERIGRRPDVRSVGAIHHLPVGSAGRFMSRFHVDGEAVDREEHLIGVRIVTQKYFDALGIPILLGRTFDERDRSGRLPAVVINEKAAVQFFPGMDPIGRRLVDFGYDPLENAAREFTVVGVVGDVRSLGLREPPQAEAYFVHAQVPLREMFVVVRTDETTSSIDAIRGELRALDRNIPAPTFRTLDQVVAGSLDRPRLFAAVLTFFSAIALTLAAVGVFGVLSFAVAQRTREIGVRMALGASPRTVVKAIVTEALMFAAIGLAIGIFGAFIFVRWLQSELFNVQPTDTVTLTGVILTVGATALLASFLPAWRAARVDPLSALRTG